MVLLARVDCVSFEAALPFPVVLHAVFNDDGALERRRKRKGNVRGAPSAGGGMSQQQRLSQRVFSSASPYLLRQESAERSDDDMTKPSIRELYML